MRALMLPCCAALLLVLLRNVAGTYMTPDPWPSTGLNIPGMGFPMACNYTCRNIPEYHKLFNPSRKYICKAEVSSIASCSETADGSTPLCVQSAMNTHPLTGEVALGVKRADDWVAPTPMEIWFEEAREFMYCARLCVEDFMGDSLGFHPNDYGWNHTHLLPMSADQCVGTSAFVIVDREKLVTVYNTYMAAENEGPFDDNTVDPHDVNYPAAYEACAASRANCVGGPFED